MIPTIHLAECPEPPAYWPDEQVMAAYVVDGVSPVAWQTCNPSDVVLIIEHSAMMKCPSESYRIF